MFDLMKHDSMKKLIKTIIYYYYYYICVLVSYTKAKFCQESHINKNFFINIICTCHLHNTRKIIKKKNKEKESIRIQHIFPMKLAKLIDLINTTT